MSKIRLYIKGLSYSQTQSGAYALVLGEEEGKRRLPIIIGGFEAQSIAIALEKEVVPPRPLTHDLFKSFAEKFEVKILEVVIHKLQEGVFYSYLTCEHQGKTEMIDARTSDAVALAIRFGSPIFTYEEILEQAGIILEEGHRSTPSSASGEETDQVEEEVAPAKPAKSGYQRLSLDELNAELAKAIEDEEYEKAARLRDEISKRQTN